MTLVQLSRNIGSGQNGSIRLRAVDSKQFVVATVKCMFIVIIIIFALVFT